MPSSGSTSVAQPYIVPDQNILRNQQAIESVKNRCIGQGLRILLPDVAIYGNGKRDRERKAGQVRNGKRDRSGTESGTERKAGQVRY